VSQNVFTFATQTLPTTDCLNMKSGHENVLV